MSKEQGKKIERFAFSELKELMKQHPCFVHRFVDSHDAGRFVSPQPSDLLFASPAVGTVYLEVKSSEVHDSLEDCGKEMFSPQQIGKMRLLQRAGQHIVCLFYSDERDEFEIWNLSNTLHDLLKGRLNRQHRVTCCSPEDLGRTFVDVFIKDWT